MKIYTLLFLIFCFTNSFAQVSVVNNNVGVGVDQPLEKLSVSNGIIIGNTTVAEAGVIRWTGTDFEGYNGTQWVSLTNGNSSATNYPQKPSANIVSVKNNNYGIGTQSPLQKLDVRGAIKIGNTNLNLNAGTIRFNGTRFQGNTGLGWYNLDAN